MRLFGLADADRLAREQQKPIQPGWPPTPVPPPASALAPTEQAAAAGSIADDTNASDFTD